MAVTGCVFVCGKACDYRYGERKIKMLSAKFDGEGNKKAKKKYISEGKGKEAQNQIIISLLCFSHKTQGNTEARISDGNRRSYGFEKLMPHPPKPIVFPLRFAVIFYLFQQDI